LVTPLLDMCYMLNIITHKEFSKQEVIEYSKEYSISLYNKTSMMTNAQEDMHYYAITILGHCACGFYRKYPENGPKLIDLLEDCLEYGEVVLFFYLDNGDYHLYENDVHSYIKKAKKVRICFEDFLDTFMTEEFEGDNIVYIIQKCKFDNG